MLKFQEALKLIRPEIALKIYENITARDIQGLPYRQLFRLYKQTKDRSLNDQVLFQALMHKAKSYKELFNVWSHTSDGTLEAAEVFEQLVIAAVKENRVSAQTNTYELLHGYSNLAGSESQTPFAEGVLEKLENQIVENLCTSNGTYLYWESIYAKTTPGTVLHEKAEEFMFTAAQTYTTRLSMFEHLDKESKLLESVIAILRQQCVKFYQWSDVFKSCSLRLMDHQCEIVEQFREEAMERCEAIGGSYNDWRSVYLFGVRVRVSEVKIRKRVIQNWIKFISTDQERDLICREIKDEDSSILMLLEE